MRKLCVLFVQIKEIVMNKTKNIVFIIYDSIYNSVFKSQVLAPIENLLKNKKNIKITLISFEKIKPTQIFLKSILKNNKINFIWNIKLIFCLYAN